MKTGLSLLSIAILIAGGRLIGQERDLFYLFPVLGLTVLLGLTPAGASAQWQLQVGYVHAFQTVAPHGGTVQAERFVGNTGPLRLYLRGQAAYHRGNSERLSPGSIHQVFQAGLAPIAELRASEVRLRGGATVGAERYNLTWLGCPPRAECITTGGRYTDQERRSFVSGILELAIDPRGPAYVFLAYHRDHVFGRRRPPGHRNPHHVHAGIGINL